MAGSKKTNGNTRAATALFVAVTMVLGLGALASGQDKPAAPAMSQIKLGVLPFVDNTASGGDEIGVTVGRAVQAELSHSTKLVGRVLKLDGITAEEVDSEKAVEMARAANVDVVLIGAILDATSDESEKGVTSPSIFGQSVGGRARSVKASVTLQGDIYNVVDGTKIDSIRVTGKASDTKVGADVSTDFGSLSSDSSSLQSSPVGKALTSAVAELVKKIAGNEKKMQRLQPPGL